MSNKLFNNSLWEFRGNSNIPPSVFSFVIIPTKRPELLANADGALRTILLFPFFEN
jgi:hypothetical protein